MTRREFFSRSAMAVAAVAVAAHVPADVPVGVVQVYGAQQEGAELLTRGWAAGEGLQIGDVFTIAGQYALNPLTFLPTELPQHFVVTATVTSDALGVLRLPILPPIVTRGYLQTSAHSPANGAVVNPECCGDSIPCNVEWTDA